ncbi:MAG: SidA/IucD/PvdA family monooxygenase [Collimonas pratensis]|uniref:lysine N(6)-hydroxylase/L-ornithine N(5)-oxygenase family protein n=1 Tax=Collimonas pratensis TaxID=279113 RepID=UPI003C768F5D
MQTFDLVGIGVGPFNLSLAALAEPTGMKSLFLEKNAEFSWHPGLMLPNGSLQVSPLKDCVTLADPTSPYSFLNYLALHQRLYSFINKHGANTSRREFADYYRWVAQQLASVRFGEEVVDVTPCDDGFYVSTPAQRYIARSIALGIGIEPHIPDCARQWLGSTVCHAANFLEQPEIAYGERVMVVGGGQSGAEIVEHLLGMPDIGQITWITSRGNLFAMDESSFVNESYLPSYSQYFQSLPLGRRRAIVSDEKLTSDGISAALSNRIYELMYERCHVEGRSDLIRVVSNVAMTAIAPVKQRWKVLMQSQATGNERDMTVDRIVLATGFRPRRSPFIDKIIQHARMEDGLPVMRDDYSVEFKQPMRGKVYLQNRSRIQHGLQSVNLSLVAYRSSRIVNSVLGRNFYPEVPDSQLLNQLESFREPSKAVNLRPLEVVCASAKLA